MLKFHLKIEFGSQSQTQQHQDHTLHYQLISTDVMLQHMRVGRVEKMKTEKMGRSAESRRTDVMKTNEQEENGETVCARGRRPREQM